ncbi:hypothetical protein APHAL10511_000073 [Amanita phalloides]|nr:hypothetical protein APHAL10511_000073 [Amanita phalloides]
MSVARAVLVLARPLQRRFVSNVTHGEHEHYHREDFSSPVWRNALIASLLAVVACKYAPEPGDGTYLTRWIAFYQTPRSRWLEMNADHTVKQLEASEQNILLSDAQKEPAHRYRYPQIMDQASPFLKGVGM